MFILRLVVQIVLYSILAVTILNGCTTINMINNRLEQLMYVDSAIVPFLDKFKAEAKLRSIYVDSSTLTMILGEAGTKDERGTVGTCQLMSGRPIIIIDRDYWQISNDAEKEELVFHELGHCLLDRDHCEKKDSKGVSISIMEPEMLEGKMYPNNRERYVDELFKPDKSCKKRIDDKFNSHFWM